MRLMYIYSLLIGSTLFVKSPCLANNLDCELPKTSVDSNFQTIDETNYLVKLDQIKDILLNNNNCFTKLQLQEIYQQAAKKIVTYDKNGNLLFELKMNAILNGFFFFMVLEDLPAIYLKDNFPSKYQKLENLTDSMFLIHNKNINTELAFVLRSMVRRDQAIRTRETQAYLQMDTLAYDSLMGIMREVDLMNEKLLGEIFEKYGYPGYSIVGTEHNACSLLMHHMSLDFQFQNIHLLIEAVNKKELFENLNFLIDKILYAKFNLTLFGTHWSNDIPVNDQKIIDKYMSILSNP